MDGVPCPDVLWDLRGSVNDELFAGIPIGFVGLDCLVLRPRLRGGGDGDSIRSGAGVSSGVCNPVLTMERRCTRLPREGVMDNTVFVAGVVETAVAGVVETCATGVVEPPVAGVVETPVAGVVETPVYTAGSLAGRAVLFVSFGSSDISGFNIGALPEVDVGFRRFLRNGIGLFSLSDSSPSCL